VDMATARQLISFCRSLSVLAGATAVYSPTASHRKVQQEGDMKVVMGRFGGGQTRKEVLVR